MYVYLEDSTSIYIFEDGVVVVMEWKTPEAKMKAQELVRQLKAVNKEEHNDQKQ